MASFPIVLLAALGAGLYYSWVGWALARWLRLAWVPAAAVAPALGWGVFSAVSFPLQDVLGFTRTSTALVAVAILAASLAALARSARDHAEPSPRFPPWAFALAAAVALIPLAGLLPKTGSGGIILGPTVFDHSKIAMVDEMTRLGLPAGNPFFGAFGARSALTYYFLWHFGAAQLSILGGVTGWEADAAMTGVTAYASLLMMMGLAVGVARTPAAGTASEADAERRQGRAGIAVTWVALLSLAGSLRPLLLLMLGQAGVDRLLSSYRGLAGWTQQASWVPQHLASACCVVLCALLLTDLAQMDATRTGSKPRRVGLLLTAGALAAAGFGSSAWVGGVTFAFVAAGVGVVGLLCARGRERVWFAASALAAAAFALALAAPFLHAEFGTLAGRHGGSPIAYHPYEVIGAMVPADGLRRALDYPAYWLLLLPVELPAIYPAGVAALALRLHQARRRGDLSPHLLSLAGLAVISFATGWLLVSTIGNNDLGWRAILPGTLVLTAFAAAGLARWIAVRAYAGVAAAVSLFAASAPERLIFANLRGKPTENAPDFAQGPALWAAVRRYAGPSDRVADNPLYLDDMTDWPVNPSWAMLSDRASCYSGWETARAYVDLPQQRILDIDSQFIRVFTGKGTADDVRQMAQEYGCKVVVLTSDDDGWDKDPFAASPYYRLAEQREDQWRVYVARTPLTPAKAVLKTAK